MKPSQRNAVENVLSIVFSTFYVLSCHYLCNPLPIAWHC